MHSGALRSDLERLNQAAQNNSTIDNIPTQPEHLNWRMRQRLKHKQIGPEFRFNSHTQAERLFDSVRSQIGHNFREEDYTRGSGFNNEKAIKTYIKTGEFNFVPGINPDHYDSETDLKAALKRENKIH